MAQNSTEHGIFPSLFRSRWDSLSNADKWAFYNKVSLQSLLVFHSLFFAVGLDRYITHNSDDKGSILDIFTHADLLILTLSLPVIAISVIILDRVPELNPRSTKDYRSYFRKAFSFTITLWLISSVLSITDSTSISFTLIHQVCTYCLASAYLPFLRHRWWATLPVSFFSALVFFFPPLTGSSSEGFNNLSDFGAGFYIGFILTYPFALVGLTRITIWSTQIMARAERLAELQRALTLSEERLRFAQEMHDTLGQHLAAISMKTELARVLAQREDPRLYEELDELHKLTRRASIDMRAVAQGYRTINLEEEITEAKALIQAAGIEFTVLGETELIPHNQQELSAWLVREAATNILKHSTATKVTLSMNEDSLSIRNDGADMNTETLRLGGLHSLSQRALSHYETRLSVEKEGGNFCVALYFTDSSPASSYPQ